MAGDLFSDDFNRSNSATVGDPDVGGGTWSETETGGTAAISSNTLVLTDSSNPNNVVVSSAFDSAYSPLQIDFRMKNNDVSASYFIINFKSSGTSIFAIEAHNATSQLDVQGGSDFGAVSDDTYCVVQLKNINWTAHTYDVWLDSTEKATGVAFANNSSSIDSVTINTGGSQTGTITFDYVYLISGDASVSPTLLSLSFSEGTPIVNNKVLPSTISIDGSVIPYRWLYIPVPTHVTDGTATIGQKWLRTKYYSAGDAVALSGAVTFS